MLYKLSHRSLQTQKHVDPVVVRVRHEQQEPVGTWLDRHVVGLVELVDAAAPLPGHADRAHVRAVLGEDLDPLVAVVRHEQVAVRARLHAHAAGHAELVVARARLQPQPQPQPQDRAWLG